MTASGAGVMRAAVIEAPGSVAVREVPIPQLESNEVLVKLEGCGVCASNIPPWEGREWFSYPMEPGQLGHEGWGTVYGIGDSVVGFQPGDRVCMLSNHAYAEFDKAEVGAVVKIPAPLHGKPFPGEPLACALNIFKRSGIQRGDTIAIVGVGFLGSLLIQLAHEAGANVIALSRREDAREVATAAGASSYIPLDDHWRVIEKVKELTEGRFCDVVIEATGKQWPLDVSAELTKEMGRLIIAGYHQDGLRTVNMQLWNWRGLDVINAHEREQAVYLEGMRRAADAVILGRIDPSPLYTHRLTLENLGEALNLTKERPSGFMKALIEMGD